MSNDQSIAEVLEGATPVETPETPVETPEPVAEAAPETPEAPAPEAEAPTVPVAVMVEQRKQMQAEIEFLRGIAQKPEPVAPTPEPEPIDFIAEPDKAVESLRSEMRNETQQLKNQMSLTYAQRTFGADVVQTAFNAVKATGDPAVAAALQAQPDPYGAMVDWHKKQQMLAEVGSDPAAYEAKLREKIMAEMKAQQSVTGEVTPPGSLAGGTNVTSPDAGGDIDKNALLKSIIG